VLVLHNRDHGREGDEHEDQDADDGKLAFVLHFITKLRFNKVQSERGAGRQHERRERRHGGREHEDDDKADEQRGERRERREHRRDDRVVAVRGYVHAVGQEPPEAAQKVAAARDHEGEECGDDGALDDGGLVFDRVELRGHLRQAPGAERGEDHDAEQVVEVRAEERGEDAGGLGHRGVGDLCKTEHGFLQSAELPQWRPHDHDDADQHDDALHEVVHDGRHVAARHDVDCGEHGHGEDADCVVNAEGHREQAREAVVQGSRVGDEEQEDDERCARLERGAVVALFKEVGHGAALQVLGHDARAPAEHGPGEIRADDRVADADPGRGNAVFPAELARVADHDDGGEVRGAVGEGCKPGADRAAAEDETVHVLGVPAAVEANYDHQTEEQHQHQNFPE